VAAAVAALKDINKLPITSVTIGQLVYLDLRFFDGNDRLWYDSLKLPQRSSIYVVACQCVSIDRSKKRPNFPQLSVFCPLFNQQYLLFSADIVMYISQNLIENSILVDASYRALYPAMFSLFEQL